MLKLIIGSPELSSWSMRAWLAVRRTGAEFLEETITLDQPNTGEHIARYSSTGRVPVLIHENITIEDSLAISLYMTELKPESNLLPKERSKRARALSLISEIHSSFASLRKECPMKLRNQPQATAISESSQQDIKRIVQIIESCHGPYMLGEYSIVDCFMAPLMTRINTYGISVPQATQTYVKTILSHPHVVEWCEKANQR